MALKNMTYSLYSKIALWLVLNLVLLAVLGFGIGWYVLLGNGLVPAHFFSSNIENSFRLVSVNLQYRSVFTWQKLLKQYDRGEALRFHLRTLETGVLYDDCIPEKVIQAAMAIPKSSFTLCPDPDMQLWDSLRGGFFDTQQRNMEAGLPPIPPAIFVRTHSPARYWYGRVLYIPDKNHQLHYVLLALETDSFYGYGLFFEFRGVLLVILAVLGVSCLWWWPFVRHLTKPIILMTKVTERIAAGDYSSLSDDSPISLKAVGEGRGDQIGCLAKATGIMAEKVKQQVHGQRRFIRHIAHELDSPLARIKLGLAVLDSRVDEKNQQRVQEISDEVEQLSLLVEDVLSFMRSEAIPESPAREAVSLAPLLQYVTRREARDRDVRLSVDEGLKVWADASCLGRALANVVRNAVRYAGEDGPIAIAARPQGDRVCVEIRDSGPGVPAEEMEHITDPFFRGEQAKKYPGGSGLGMSIVKHCVEACGGELHYYNQYPKGFTVSITLKACDK